LSFAAVAHADLTNKPYQLVYLVKRSTAEQEKADTAQVEAFMQAAQAKGWAVSHEIKVTPTWISVVKRAGESLQDLVAGYGRCTSLDACKVGIDNLNRDPEVFNDAYAGPVIIPANENYYDISIDAGANYREEKIGNRTTAVMSRELDALLKPIVRKTVGRFAMWCQNVDNPESCSYYDVRVE
jgi:hypothetical protein